MSIDMTDEINENQPVFNDPQQGFSTSELPQKKIISSSMHFIKKPSKASEAKKTPMIRAVDIIR
jgi:hypothetical protein